MTDRYIPPEHENVVGLIVGVCVGVLLEGVCVGDTLGTSCSQAAGAIATVPAGQLVDE